MDAKGKIETLCGAEEFKQFTAELVRVTRTARRRHLQLGIPTLLMVTRGGQGNTTYLRLLTELIREERLLTFSGEEEVFEWRMLADDEQAVSRLMTRMEHAAGFYPYFSGVIGLDLSDFEEPEELPESLFELIRENSGRNLFCLMIPEKQATGLRARLEEMLKIYTRVKTIRVTATDQELCAYVRNELRRRGFLLSKELEEPIRSFVAAEGKNGYRSLHMAIEEAIWRKMDRNDGLLIEAKDLAVCGRQAEKDSRSGSRKRVIGFGAHEP